MGRQKRFATDAERQQAYRLRLAEKQKHTPTATSPKPRRPPSRQTRLESVVIQVQQLHDECAHWHTSMPEGQQDSDLAERLSDTIEQLANILELLSDLDLPRGFGRD
jgi:hypothetical protein